MLDIKFVRENPEIVKENIKKKFQDEKLPLVDEAIRLDEERRDLRLSLKDQRTSVLTKAGFTADNSRNAILYSADGLTRPKSALDHIFSKYLPIP